MARARTEPTGRPARPSRPARPKAKRGYTKLTLVRAKKLRREKSEAEIKLWSGLRNRQLANAKFREQQPIGPYVGDFVCHDHGLVIEADGSQHLDSRSDARRDAYMLSKGYRTMRFWNNDILLNLDGVLTAIYHALTTPHPPIASQWVPPSPSRGEGKQEP